MGDMEEPRRIRCNHCTSEFDEDRLDVDAQGPDTGETCPVCSKGDALMDIDLIPPPPYKPGDHVRIRNDEGEWEEAWIVEMIPTYRYTIRRPPDGLYRGGTIVGVYKQIGDIRPWEKALNG